MNATLSRRNHRPPRIHLLGGLLTLTTIAALIGGAALLADPTGRMLGLAPEDLAASPFGDYVVPGAILLGLFGLVPLPILLGLWKQRRWAQVLAGLLGAGLAVWAVAQILWLGPGPLSRWLVWAVGLTVLAAAGAPVWRTARA